MLDNSILTLYFIAKIYRLTAEEKDFFYNKER